MKRLPTWIGGLALASACVLVPMAPHAQTATPRAVTVRATTPEDLRQSDARVDRMLRAGEARLVRERRDTMMEGRRHQRLRQYHQGVPIVGADLTRQLDANGVTLSTFGRIYDGLTLDTTPAITGEAATLAVEELARVKLGPGRKPSLVILPNDDGSFVLAWRTQAFTGSDLRVYFIDAKTGALAFEYSNLQTQSVGVGKGVLGDSKKISVKEEGGAYRTSDELRPPSIVTYDMKGNYKQLVNILNGWTTPSPSDVAVDSDNDWEDGAVVDGHVYLAWTYDYFYKRFERRGLDNDDMEMRGFVHPVNRDQVLSLYSSWSLFYTNAFYAGDGVMVFGEGLPSIYTSGGKHWNYVSGALDIVAHELAHGVTDYSSELIYMNESGALNEAFSDIMAVGTEYYAEQFGGKPGDYLIGEDVVTPGGLRSLKEPWVNQDPEHYARRYTGSGDNGGVHTNATIGGHAFYLAIEGGTNRHSGSSVQGVGGANREQIEKVFYRAFTYMLPSGARFSDARAATIQAARELYGSNSAAERAVTQAWTAVGVM